VHLHTKIATCDLSVPFVLDDSGKEALHLFQWLKNFLKKFLYRLRKGGAARASP
jgi:hypothetical protein